MGIINRDEGDSDRVSLPEPAPDEETMKTTRIRNPEQSITGENSISYRIWNVVCLRATLVLIVLAIPLFLYSQNVNEQLKQMRSTVIQNIDGKEYYIHTIKRGQTLYMISKVYGVEVNDLIRENPEVNEGIKADQKIRVPHPGAKVARTLPPTGKEKADDAKPAGPGTRTATTATRNIEKPDTVPVMPELPCGIDSSSKKPVYRVALMLPLYLKESQLLDPEKPVRKIVENSKSLQFIPFYEGFRMALDTLEKTGVKIRLYVYDVEKDTLKTKQLLKNPDLKKMDLIIGMLYHRNFKMVADFAEINKIPIINPISERSDVIAGNPYVFKAIPSRKTQLTQVAKCFSDNFSKDQVLIVKSGQYPDREAPERLKKECLDRNLNVLLVDGQEGAIGKLSKNKENVLVVFSDNAAYSLDLTRRFYELRNDYSITVFGLPEWGTMEGLETEYLLALKAHFVAKQFIDYSDPKVKWFVDQYQKRYSTDPALMAFQGFDIACYFLTALKTYGARFPRCIGEFSMKSLQTQFEFGSAKGNGFENQRWMIYKFENYRLVPVY